MEAAARLVSALRAKFRGDSGAKTLDTALGEPDDGARGELGTLLRERIREDDGFAAWIETLWTEAGPDIKSDDRTTNDAGR